MLHASTRKLIDRLSEMTELGKLDWTNSEDGTFAYATEGYSVSLTESPNEVIITSKDGKELERATAEELAATHQEDGAVYTAIVAAMTMEASRVARGTEAAISSLLAGMQDAPDAATPEPDAADADVDEDLQEDPVNESTAIITEPIAPIEATTDVEASADPEPATEVERTEDAVAEDETASSDSAGSIISTAGTEESHSEQTNDVDDTEITTAEEVETPTEIETTSEDTLEPETEIESESEVTQAVARLADEVNQREDTDLDTGLDAAAASAAGAVALAAGLAVQPASNEDEASSPAAETDDTPEVGVVSEASAAPAYIPFGLEPEDEGESEAVAIADSSLQDTPEPAEVVVEPETETPLAAPVSSFAFTPTVEAEPAPAEPMWNTPAAEAETELETEPDIETAQEPTEDPTPEPAFAAAAPLDTASESDLNRPAETEDAAEESLAEIAATASIDDAEVVEAATDAAEPAAPIADPKPPTTYSLSGIGAGFGLGALSAKTEASGIPGPNSSNTTPQEKVIIDATDDVLPELEGNLNVSLAETASAAVSAANAEAAAAEPADAPPADAETDILKPRTRFNPWD